MKKNKAWKEVAEVTGAFWFYLFKKKKKPLTQNRTASNPYVYKNKAWKHV